MVPNRANRSESGDTETVEAGELHIALAGEITVLPAGSELSFGRSADLVIDSDMRLHRVMGRFVDRQGTWWLENLGSRIRLQIHARDSGSTTDLAPGAAQPVTSAATDVSFRVGESAFGLLVSQSPTIVVRTLPPQDTVGPTIPDLNDEQLDLVLALSRPRLLNPTSVTIPTTKEVAVLLGWKTTKVNRKFDYLFKRVEALGEATQEQLRDHSHDRRAILVQLAIEQRWATHERLAERGWD